MRTAMRCRKTFCPCTGRRGQNGGRRSRRIAAGAGNRSQPSCTKMRTAASLIPQEFLTIFCLPARAAAQANRRTESGREPECPASCALRRHGSCCGACGGSGKPCARHQGANTGGGVHRILRDQPCVCSARRQRASNATNYRPATQRRKGAKDAQRTATARKNNSKEKQGTTRELLKSVFLCVHPCTAVVCVLLLFPLFLRTDLVVTGLPRPRARCPGRRRSGRSDRRPGWGAGQ